METKNVRVCWKVSAAEIVDLNTLINKNHMISHKKCVCIWLHRDQRGNFLNLCAELLLLNRVATNRLGNKPHCPPACAWTVCVAELNQNKNTINIVILWYNFHASLWVKSHITSVSYCFTLIWVFSLNKIKNKIIPLQNYLFGTIIANSYRDNLLFDCSHLVVG